MTFAKTAASAAILFLALGASGTFAADASAPANLIACLDISKKAAAALDAGRQSPNYDLARTESSVARDYCARHMYQIGVARYAKVLQLLGAG